MKQIALPLRVALEPDFENYLACDNTTAVQAVLASLNTAGQPTLYLWGAPGTGKTHLLRAAWRYAAQRGLHAGQIGLLTTTDTDPDRFDPNWSVVVFEDVHLYSPEQQQQAFAWMIHAQSAACNVIATGAAPPVNLNLRDDLRTRLAWGQVFALQPLSDTNCRVILRRQAHARGIHLSDEVVEYVMMRFSRDLTSLQHLLERLDTYSLEVKRSVTVPLINTMFRAMESQL